MEENTIKKNPGESYLTVKELADKHQVEKYTIQYVLKALKLENDAIDENNNNAHLYGEDSQAKIDDYMNTKYRGGKEQKEIEKENLEEKDGQYYENIHSVQQEYINTLLDQIDVKDRQIRSKDEQLSSLDERQKNLLSLIAMEKNETQQLEQENKKLEEQNKELLALVADTEEQAEESTSSEERAKQDQSIEEIKALMAKNQEELRAMEQKLNDYQSKQQEIIKEAPQEKQSGFFSRIFGKK